MRYLKKTDNKQRITGNYSVPLRKQIKDKVMTVVSTKEFNSNQEKYFDMALNDHVYIQRGNGLFIFCISLNLHYFYSKNEVGCVRK